MLEIPSSSRTSRELLATRQCPIVSRPPMTVALVNLTVNRAREWLHLRKLFRKSYRQAPTAPRSLQPKIVNCISVQNISKNEFVMMRERAVLTW